MQRRLNSYLMAACSWPGTAEEADKCAIALSRLPAGSTQWTQPKIVSERDGYSNQNPVLYHDVKSSVTYLFHSQLEANQGEGLDVLVWLRSTDFGVTWTNPTQFYSISKGGVFDRNRIIQRADGSLLFPLYYTTDGKPNSAFFLISDTKNASIWDFSHPFNLAESDNLVQPSVVRINSSGNDNTIAHNNSENPSVKPSPPRRSVLKVFLRDRESKNVYGAESEDEGLTWTKPTPEQAGNLPNNNAGIEAFQLLNGHTILLYNNNSDSKAVRTPLTASISLDGGQSWAYSRNLQVHDDNSTTAALEFSYPTVLQTPDGMIHAAYTYDRQCIKYISFKESYITGGK